MTRASKTMEESKSKKPSATTTTTTNCQKHKVLDATQKRKRKGKK